MADRSLLDRLNALKPSNVTLESNARPEGVVPSAASDLNPPPPHVSREDALTSRLRLLRNGGLSESPAANPDPPVPSQPLPADKLHPADTSSDVAADAGGVDRQQADLQSQQPPITLYDDPYTLNEEALDDLLDGLDQDFDLSDVDFDPSTLGRAEQGKARDGASSQGGPDAPDSDDSDGEPMSRDVDKLLSQLRDELALSAQQDDKADNPRVKPTQHTADGPTPGAAADDPLGLPTVPDQLPTTDAPDPARKSLDFENDMSTRLASLRGIGSDPFGLPVAPTFQPADRSKKKTTERVMGYTDEDQKTWCIVCLDDATIRCVGCGDDDGEGDVYCARCWREMHLGPSASWDARGHQWVRFVRR